MTCKLTLNLRRSVLPLEQSIIEWLQYTLEDGCFIDLKVVFIPGVQKWITVVLFRDTPHHTITEDGWWPFWILGTFALASYDIQFLFYSKHFLICEQDFLNKFLQLTRNCFFNFSSFRCLKHRRSVQSTFCKLGNSSLLWEHMKQFLMSNSSIGKGFFA